MWRSKDQEIKQFITCVINTPNDLLRPKSSGVVIYQELKNWASRFPLRWQRRQRSPGQLYSTVVVTVWTKHWCTGQGRTGPTNRGSNDRNSATEMLTKLDPWRRWRACFESQRAHDQLSRQDSVFRSMYLILFGKSPWSTLLLWGCDLSFYLRVEHTKRTSA